MKKNVKNKIDHIRHSLAHLLAASVLKKWPDAKLGIGPTIENGFYYDFLLDHRFNENDLKYLENEIKKLINQNLIFKGRKISVDNAKKLFKNQKFKLELIKDFVKEKKPLSVYEIINAKTKEILFIDLCRGGHIKNTKEINPLSFKLSHIAGAYWKGSEKNPQLQRIYGIAFESEKELNDYLKQLELAEKCDHRYVGQKLEIFMIDEEIGKGLPILLPNGYKIRKKLEDYIYQLEKNNNYQHVLTSILAKENLYKKSGHLLHYKEDMYAPIEIENEKYYLKPMNCPHHHSIYKTKKRSYKELPLRLAEFGHVHRFERSGVLSGLIRVRGFTQNDSHIYMTENQLKSEIENVLIMAQKVYKDFDIKDYWYRLSLPNFKNKEKYGDIKNKKIWEKGSNILKKALKELGHKFIEAIGEASFYGPKIDIQIKNIYGKEDTIGTVQVDYYSAKKFDLYYIDEKGKEQPVVIVHRAIMGSFERFMAFLLEKTCGYLPLWISSVQVKILPINDKLISYAEKIKEELKKNNIDVEIDYRNETLSKKIREAEIMHIPYIVIVGEKEQKNNSVSIRHPEEYQKKYSNFKNSEMSLENFINKIKLEIIEKK
ncbi:MAG: threonine--tRNA ligase [bacterium]|nr:threonine--tRNA ligase [bacterium]